MAGRQNQHLAGELWTKSASAGAVQSAISVRLRTSKIVQSGDEADIARVKLFSSK